MIKKNAMSTMGYAIVLVIILGVVMIVSAPMMMNKVKDGNNSPDKYSKEDNKYDDNRDRYEDNSRDRENDNSVNSSSDISNEMRMLEDRMNSRLSELESRQSQKTQSSTITDKYVCSIEGNVDADGNVTPIDNMNMEDVKRKKIVFVCEYRN